MDDDQFLSFLLQRGRELYRNMPWRQDTRPYYVLVSELMLQQTQVPRVIPKFQAFIERFPDERSLATASLADVLLQWQGLGYNRRAKFLHEAARIITAEYAGVIPSSTEELMKLPGVGQNTAGAIQVYAFNQPSLFIETNIRTVYIHHFFADQPVVTDSEIRAKLEATIDTAEPRKFYQALMDYGTYLKSTGVKLNARSRHFVKQKPLRGSVRELRGMIIKTLSNGETSTLHQFASDPRFEQAIASLLSEGLIELTRDNAYRLTR